MNRVEKPKPDIAMQTEREEDGVNQTRLGAPEIAHTNGVNIPNPILVNARQGNGTTPERAEAVESGIRGGEFEHEGGHEAVSISIMVSWKQADQAMNSLKLRLKPTRAWE